MTKPLLILLAIIVVFLALTTQVIKTVKSHGISDHDSKPLLDRIAIFIVIFLTTPWFLLLKLNIILRWAISMLKFRLRKKS